ncbi:MAG: hypothetical protein QOH57_4071 [Mycobacterium sp.]|nr:hypothetical protein [Mycobacterium sp.]
MRTFTVRERRARLARRHFLAEEPAGDPIGAVISDLVGLHATDPATPYLSLWARVPGFTVRDLDEQLYERRSVVKHLAMRRTLWLVCADDLATIQAGASDRVADNEWRRLVADVEKAGIAADGANWLDRACAAVLRHLAGTGPASTSQLRAALPELDGKYDPAPGKPWGGETHLAPRVFTILGVRGDIVRGPNDGMWNASRHRWVTHAEWFGAPLQAIPVQTARANLVRRWLHAFGPATVTDIKWWFGSTLTAARQALRDIHAVEVDLGGVAGYALPDELDDEADTEPWAALLPGLDVTAMGWADRDWYLGPHRTSIFDRNGNAGPTAWWNGRVVGGWRQDDGGKVAVQLLEDPGRDAERALQRKAEDLSAWLDGVRIAPRFPSPLSKTALLKQD